MDDTFTSILATNLRFITEGSDGWWSLSTGENENVLSNHYFDQNARHEVGDMFPMPNLPMAWHGESVMDTSEAYTSEVVRAAAPGEKPEPIETPFTSLETLPSVEMSAESEAAAGEQAVRASAPPPEPVAPAPAP